VQLPAKAVFLIGTKQYVFVEESPGRYARVPVKAGEERGGVIVVGEGVSAGQKVVVDGSLFLQHIYQRQGGK
jgi:multidrug efflux pump subunit AcrA (membrane-fusion protein)